MSIVIRFVPLVFCPVPDSSNFVRDLGQEAGWNTLLGFAVLSPCETAGNSQLFLCPGYADVHEAPLFIYRVIFVDRAPVGENLFLKADEEDMRE
jgi:hypothetical protein